MARRSLAGVDVAFSGVQIGERARRVQAIFKWLWLQFKASWFEVMDLHVRTGRDIWRPPF